MAYSIRVSPGPDGRRLYYLQDDASARSIGLIEKVVQFDQIQPISNLQVPLTNAANALYDAAVENLRRAKSVVNKFKVKVQPPRRPLMVGDKVHIRFQDDYVVGDRIVQPITLSGDYWIMGIEQDYSEETIDTYLEISDVDVKEQDATELVISTIETVQQRAFTPTVAASAYGFVIAEDIDRSHSAEIPIRISAATTALQHIDVVIQPRTMRINVSAASAGGNHNHRMFTVEETTSAPPAGLINFRRQRLAGRDSSGGSRHVDFALDDSTPTNDDIYTHDSSGSHTHVLQAGIFDDRQTPSNITLWLNGTDRTVELAGANTLNAGGGERDIVVDGGKLTDLIKGASGGIIGTHTLEVRCGGGRGRIRAIVSVFQSVQSVQVGG